MREIKDMYKSAARIHEDLNSRRIYTSRLRLNVRLKMLINKKRIVTEKFPIHKQGPVPNVYKKV